MNWLDFWIVLYKTVICYFFLIVILKIMGKREVGKVSTFDIVVFFVISELFSLSLNETKYSIFKSIVPITIIVILQVATALISLKCSKIRIWMEGKSCFIIFKGKIVQKEMKKQRYNISDLMLQLHMKDIQSPQEVEYAILENNGELSIITKKDCTVKFPEPLILDGKVNKSALKEYGKDEDYLYKKIKEKGYENFSQVFFAQDLINSFYVIPFESFEDINDVK